MKKIKAVYFDLDDTLCAYWAASRKSLREAIAEANLEIETDVVIESWKKVFQTFAKEIKTEEWYARYLESGEPSRTEHLRRTLIDLGIDNNSHAESISRRYAELRNEYLQLFPDAIPTLDALSGKYKIGLITNGPTDIQRQEVTTLNLSHYFDQILIEGEFKTGKPHEVIFQAATNKWGYEPNEMLFVGNAFEHDVQGAKRAGWHAIWINRGEEIKQETGPQPDKEISHLFEVFDWLDIPRPDLVTITIPPEMVQNWR